MTYALLFTTSTPQPLAFLTNCMHNSLHIPALPWSHRLSQILRPASCTAIFEPYTPTLRRVSNPPGDIWKHLFSVCVYSDLAGIIPNKGWRKNRHFARLEQFGLSGVVLHQTPVKRRRDGDTRPCYTLEEVFGSEEHDYEDGMSITQLLACIDTILVHFPAYACTSFTVRVH